MYVCVCVCVCVCAVAGGDGLAMIFEEGDFLVTNGVSMVVKSCLPVKRGGNGTSLLIPSLPRNGEHLLFPFSQLVCLLQWYIGAKWSIGSSLTCLTCQMSFLIPRLDDRTYGM